MMRMLSASPTGNMIPVSKKNSINMKKNSIIRAKFV